MTSHEWIIAISGFIVGFFVCYVFAAWWFWPGWDDYQRGYRDGMRSSYAALLQQVKKSTPEWTTITVPLDADAKAEEPKQ